MFASLALLVLVLGDASSDAVVDAVRSSYEQHQVAWNELSGWGRAMTTEIFDRTKAGSSQLFNRTRSLQKVDRASHSHLLQSELEATVAGSRFQNLCTAINPRYCFELTKRDLEPNWKVARVHVLGKEEPDLGKLRFANPLSGASRQMQWGCPSFAVVGLGSTVLRAVEVFQNTGTFVLESARWTDEGHAELLFVHHHPQMFAGPWAEGKHRPAPVKSRLVLARDQEFMPLEFVQTASVNGLEHEYRVTCERQLKDRLPTTERVSRRWIIREGGELRQDTETIVTSSFTYGPIPVSQFTLSAYGFPEPFGIEWDRPTPWWLYALISAGVLFIVTVIVSFWKRRLAARQAG
ncbi:MAG TPA: hypothetical protein PKD86_12210 [Gemmatales bacterium]|nr:hypothetical protein [Gemmatales bacterium]